MYLCGRYHVTQGQKLKKRNNNEEIRKIFSFRHIAGGDGI